MHNSNTHASLIRIRQNAASSPLLSLPPEIRERILKLLLGEKLIHVRYLCAEELRAYKISRNIPENIFLEGAFRNTVCSALSSFDLEPEALRDHERHEGCKIVENRWLSLHYNALIPPSPISSIPEELHHPMKDALTPLSVCRQLYEESNFILWSTNTFSFDHANSLLEFISSLNPAQKRNMKKLHLIINTRISSRWDRDWRVVLNTKHLSMLRGVETLHLCMRHQLRKLDYGIEYGDRPIDPMDPRHRIAWANAIQSYGVKTLRLLPLKHASVAIVDDWHRLRNILLLPDETKVDIAEKLRQELLDPQGAELQRAADVKRKADDKVTAAEMSKLDVEAAIRTAERNVLNLQVHIPIAAQLASQTKAAAEKAVAAVESGSALYSNTHLAKLTARAQKAEADVDKKEANLRIWQQRLTEREQQLPGAIVRLANMKQANIKSESAVESQLNLD